MTMIDMAKVAAFPIGEFSIAARVAIIMAYSELVFVAVRWAEFDRARLEQTIVEFRRREHRFGGPLAQTGS